MSLVMVNELFAFLGQNVQEKYNFYNGNYIGQVPNRHSPCQNFWRTPKVNCTKTLGRHLLRNGNGRVKCGWNGEGKRTYACNANGMASGKAMGRECESNREGQWTLEWTWRVAGEVQKSMENGNVKEKWPRNGTIGTIIFLRAMGKMHHAKGMWPKLQIYNGKAMWPWKTTPPRGGLLIYNGAGRALQSTVRHQCGQMWPSSHHHGHRQGIPPPMANMAPIRLQGHPQVKTAAATTSNGQLGPPTTA